MFGGITGQGSVWMPTSLSTTTLGGLPGFQREKIQWDEDFRRRDRFDIDLVLLGVHEGSDSCSESSDTSVDCVWSIGDGGSPDGGSLPTGITSCSCKAAKSSLSWDTYCPNLVLSVGSRKTNTTSSLNRVYTFQHTSVQSGIIFFSLYPTVKIVLK